jgi:hypothetical protein
MDTLILIGLIYALGVFVLKAVFELEWVEALIGGIFVVIVLAGVYGLLRGIFIGCPEGYFYSFQESACKPGFRP